MRKSPMRELTDAEREAVSGGVGKPDLVLVEGNGAGNLNSNAPNTPAATNGFQGNVNTGHGAFIGLVKIP